MRLRTLSARLAVLVAAGLLAAACGSADDAAPAAAPGTVAAGRADEPAPDVDDPEPTPARPSATAPLTGTPVEPAVLDRPVLAVKIENTKAARPQAGLDRADVVFEELVEGGITRFIALFHSEVPEVVGPIRSARLVDAAILPAYRGILAYSGARAEVTDALLRAGIALLVDDGGDAFYRDRSRSRSHDLFATGEALYAKGAGKDNVAPAAPVWRFADDAPAGAVTCPTATPDCGTAIDVRLSGVAIANWEYEPASGQYRRAQNGEPTRVTGSGRVGAANVVALGMAVGPGGCCDGAGSPFTRTDVVGEGRAIVLRDGKRYEARWSKGSPTDHLILTTNDGAPFPLKPGPTWVHLAPAENLPPAP